MPRIIDKQSTTLTAGPDQTTITITARTHPGRWDAKHGNWIVLRRSPVTYLSADDALELADALTEYAEMKEEDDEPTA